MNESEIPSFLFTSLPNREDKRKNVENMRLLQLWQCRYGFDKPFDHKAAVALQHQLRTQREALRTKQAQKQAKLRATHIQAYTELTTKVAEIVFKPEVRSEDVKNGDKIEWDTPIIDTRTGKKYGTPHEFFNDGCDGAVNLGWNGLHADASVDLTAYLTELKAKYEDFSYEFVFFRERKRRIMAIQKAPFPPEIPPIFRFTLHLKFQPFNTNDVTKRVRKELKKATVKT